MTGACNLVMPNEWHQPQGLSGTRTERVKTHPGLISMKLCPFAPSLSGFSALPFRQYTNIFPWRSTQTAFCLLPHSNTVQKIRQCPTSAKIRGKIGINIGSFTLGMSSYHISVKKVQNWNSHFRMTADCSNLSGSCHLHFLSEKKWHEEAASQAKA